MQKQHKTNLSGEEKNLCDGRMAFVVCGCHLQLFEEQFDVPVV